MGGNEVSTRNPVSTLLRLVEEAHHDPGDHLCCVYCLTPVTTSNQKTTLHFSQNYHLTNAEGQQFDVACFTEAWGCGMHGFPVNQDSWFSGFRWQYARCLSCEAHLGWYYEEDVPGSEERNHFFGLIIDKLIPAVSYQS